MEQEVIGLVLLAVGIVLVFLALRWRRRVSITHASRRGVIVQGPNPGIIATGKVEGGIHQGDRHDTHPPAKANFRLRALEFTAALASIIGLALTIWGLFKS